MMKLSTTLHAGITFMTAIASAAVTYALRDDIVAALGSAFFLSFMGAAIIELASDGKEAKP